MPKIFPYNPPSDPANILHIDNELIVVNKPAGLLSVPGRGESKKDCLISRMQASYPDALIVHRLDMATSGILVLARSASIHRLLSLQFQERQISKQYTAVVNGKIQETEGIVDLPLITDWPNRPKQKIDFESGKSSQTRYKVISYDSQIQTTRLKLMPITGRSHQLRVHMLAIGHYIIGDELYSPKNDIEPTQARLLLHASKISFQHPTTKKIITINCPCEF